ncbi:MAG: DUF4124 domain-containing protein [Pseudomonadota bacterium]
MRFPSGLKALCAFLTGVLLPPAVSAQALYKCIDDEGRVSYVDSKNKGSLKNCKLLSQDLPVSTISPPRAPAKAPGDFPKVDRETQRSRDSERRRILEQELATEQENLEKAKKELAEQEAVRLGGERNYQKVLDRLQPYKDKVALHERNIEAIRKELANIR